MAQPTYEYSGVCYTATSGQTIFALTSTDGNPIGYLSPSHIHVRTSADSGETWVSLPVDTAWNFADPATSIVLVTPATAGVWVDIQRKTPIDEDWVDFQAGSLLTAGQLNDAETFSLYCDQEIADSVSGLTPSIIGLDSTDDLPEGQINLYYTDARVSAWIAANLSDTDDLKEGVLNLYYTDARVNAWINTNLSSTDQLAEGSSNLYYTDARAEAVVVNWIAANLSDTDDLPEGSINLYFTNARVASWISNNLSSTDQLAEGSNNLYYTDARVESYVDGQGYVKGPVVTKIVAGNNVGISPESGTGIVTINATGGSGAGIPEAPLDGTAYGRQDGHWEPVLMLTGGDLTGDLTLGTDKITLDAGTGSATFAGDGHFKCGNDAHPDMGVQFVNDGEVKIYRPTGGGGSVNLISGSAGIDTPSEQFAIKADGSATFSGSVQSGGDPNNGVNVGCKLYGGQGTVAATASGGINVWVGHTQGTTAPTSTISESGSASFKGDVAIGDSSAAFNLISDVVAALPAEIKEEYADVINTWNLATPYTDPTVLPGVVPTPLIDAIVRATTAGKINLNANDGSASFSGDITKSDSANGSTSCIIGDDFLRIYDTPQSITDFKISLDNDGSGYFAGGKFTISDKGNISRVGTGGNYYDLGAFNNSGTTTGNVGGRLVLFTDTPDGIPDVQTIALNGQDGSATFSGDVQIGGDVNLQESGVHIDNAGYVLASCTTGAVFAGFTAGSSTVTSQINADGSASFSGGLATIDKWGQLNVNGPTANGYALQTRILDGPTTCFITAGGSITATGYSMASLAQL